MLVFTDMKPVLRRRSILGIDCWLVLFVRCLPIRCVGRGTSSFSCCAAVQEMSRYGTSKFITHLTEPAVGPNLNYTNNYRVLVSFLFRRSTYIQIICCQPRCLSLLSLKPVIVPHLKRGLFLCVCMLFTDVVAC
jgi:hypothetical protein